MCRAYSRYVFIILLFLIGLLLVFVLSSLTRNDIEYWFLSVGQGDATLIRTPKGTDILVDGGPDRSVLRELSSIMPIFDKTIDLIVVTHLHADHISGVIEVLNNYQVKYIAMNQSNYQSPCVDRLNEIVQMAKDKGTIVRGLYRGEQISIGDSLVLKVLWPPESYLHDEDINEESIVIEVIENGKEILLLPGDYELDDVQDDFGLKHEIMMIKVPHQGSKDAIDENVLKITKPMAAVISVGHNSYGHPHQDILNLLSSQEVSIYRLDTFGTLGLIVDGRGELHNISK